MSTLQTPDLDALSEVYRPIRRSEYRKLVEAGCFDNEKVELLFGRIVVMSSSGGPHAARIAWLNDRLVRALGDRALVWSQLSVAASEISEPEPDLAIVDRMNYHAEIPSDAHLAVEVAYSSRLIDLRIKPRVYAEMGVPEYWVVDLVKDVVVVHRDPHGGGYRDVQVLGREADVAIVRFPDIAFAVRDLLDARF